MAEYEIMLQTTIRQRFKVTINDPQLDPWEWGPGDDDEPVSETEITEVTSITKLVE